METETEELVCVTVTTDNGYDVREDVFFACAGAKLPIYEMTNMTRNLEDIFLELTQGAQTHGEAVNKEPVGAESSETIEEREENDNAGGL